ncbi:MAG: polysaccharide deacetylase family protein [Thermomicrobiales bacterium]|nr:polysaccharide deacetylase family protein [Thermomicrobiales bacterium]
MVRVPRWFLARGNVSRACLGLALLVLLSGCGIAAPPALPTATPAPTATPLPPTATPLPPTATPPPATPVPPTATAIPPTAIPATVAPTALPVADAGADSGLAQVYEYGETGRYEIALTFDAGADRGYAEEILDLLQAEGIQASFGIMGQWAQENPDLLQRMIDEGHMLFNHSWTHASFTGVTTQTAPLTTEERWQELQLTEQAVLELSGYQLQPWFRPPYGDYDEQSLRDLAAIGYTKVLLWSCDTRDSLGATAEEILNNCIYTAQPGRIVLMHVGGQSEAYAALPTMIAYLREQGFTFVRADRILEP